MPSGITHILIAKNLSNQDIGENLKDIIAQSAAFFLIGSIAPDLPYSSIFDDDFLNSDTDLADKFHYEKTTQLPLAYLKQIKENLGTMSSDVARYNFGFVLGYIAHVIGDGIMHPFVRDVVGNYDDHQEEHRILEMQIDVLFTHSLTSNTGRSISFKKTEFHDELLDIFSHEKEYKEVLTLFSKMINITYGKQVNYRNIEGWIKGLHRALNVAQSDYLAFYRKLPIIDGITYNTFDDLIEKKDDILILREKYEGGANFLSSESIHFINDCVPKFYEVFIPIAQKALEYLSAEDDEALLPDLTGINLDTGRDLANSYDLNITPFYWS